MHNTADVAHRYAVTVTVEHDGMAEDVQASSERVEPDARTTVSAEVLGGEDARCTVAGAQAHPG